MESFRTDVDSLGHYSVEMLPGVTAVRIFADESDRTVHMEICLKSDTWPARGAVIDQMLEIRELFIDDFSITYSFGQLVDDELAVAEGVSPSVYAGRD